MVGVSASARGDAEDRGDRRRGGAAVAVVAEGLGVQQPGVAVGHRHDAVPGAGKEAGALIRSFLTDPEGGCRLVTSLAPIELVTLVTQFSPDNFDRTPDNVPNNFPGGVYKV